jgi:predicted lipoprotein with Yx(FWY)xxD motif
LSGNQAEELMKFTSILAGAAALAFFSLPALAADYVGGAIKSADIGGKSVLTDANGMTLYTFDKDSAGVTNCYDKCATNWPPLFAAADAKPEGDFTLVDRTDGSKMWAYKGWPLYLWVKDTKPGDTTGDMVGEVWHTAIE